MATIAELIKQPITVVEKEVVEIKKEKKVERGTVIKYEKDGYFFYGLIVKNIHNNNTIKILNIKEFNQREEAIIYFFPLMKELNEELTEVSVGIGRDAMETIDANAIIDTFGTLDEECMKYIVKEERNNRFIYVERGEVVEYEKDGEVRYGLNIQNYTGNRMSPIIIVQRIKEFAKEEDVVVPFFKFNDKTVGIDLFEYDTIDKDRITKQMGKISNSLLNQIDELLLEEFNEEKEYEVVFIDLKTKSEEKSHVQKGERPAIAFKQKDNTWLVSPTTCKTWKLMNEEIQILVPKGEGNIKEDSLVLNETWLTLKYDPNHLESDIRIEFVGMLGKEKSKEIAIARYKSIGVIPFGFEKAQ